MSNTVANLGKRIRQRNLTSGSAAETFGMGGPERSPTMLFNDPRMSPSERFLARRRRIFLRYWVLALIALGLAISAGALRPDGSAAERSRPEPTAPLVR